MAPESLESRTWSAQSARAKAAILLVLLLTLLSAHRMRVSVPNLDINDTVAAFDSRFGAARDTLPSRGVFGYFSDSDFFGGFFLTEYALAPRVVYRAASWRGVRGGRFTRKAFALTFGTYNVPRRIAESTELATFPSGRIMVVGNFKSSDSIPTLTARNGLIVRRDYGRGAVLLEPDVQ